MRIYGTSYILVVSVALTAAVGCSGVSSQLAPTPYSQNASSQGSTESLRVGVGDDLTPPGGLYVGEFSASEVAEYSVPDKKNLGPRCVESPERYSGVAGITVDTHRILYVAYNENSTHDVATFGPNCGKQGPTLVDPNGDAGAVAVDNKRNAVYVANENTGNVEVYKNGSTSPTGELDKYHGSGFGLAVDRAGDVFDSGLPIIEYPHGRNGLGKTLALSGLNGPVGLSFDRNDNLLVTNEYNIAIYAPPYNGAPKQTIVTQPFCVYSAVDAQNKNLYVSEQTNNAVDVYAYPAGTFKYSITTGIPPYSVYGIALDPTSKT